MYYLVEKHCVPRRLNVRSFFRYESFSSTQAAPSNVLTESMALLARIAKCEVRIYTSPARSVRWLSFRTLFENSLPCSCSCRLYLNVLVQEIGPSSGYPTNCESSTLARKSICELFCAYHAPTIFIQCAYKSERLLPIDRHEYLKELCEVIFVFIYLFPVVLIIIIFV